MPIEIKNLKALPIGHHTGVIVNAEQTMKSFGLGKNPEATLEITIQPKNPADGSIYNTESVVFSPIVAPVSALGKLLARLEMEPDYKTAVSFDEATLIGKEVAFDVERQPKNPAFGRINKDSITLQ